jgi:hypothetical protein
MVASFIAVLTLQNFWALIAAQVAFGWCIGLIYYSSLYYSMHVGEAKAEHGGMHEAVIGLGIFAGPAMGAASVHFFPGQRQSSVIGVALVLAAGFCALVLARRQRLRTAPAEVVS